MRALVRWLSVFAKRSPQIAEAAESHDGAPLGIATQCVKRVGNLLQLLSHCLGRRTDCIGRNEPSNIGHLQAGRPECGRG